MAYFLIYIGQVKIWIGNSSVSVSLSFLAIIVPFLYVLIKHKSYLNKEIILLVFVVATGVFSFLLSPINLNFPRTLVAMIPLISAIAMLFSFGKNPLDTEIVNKYIIIGASILSLLVIILFFKGIVSSDNFYEIKLFIETPLGRSNYISAFLIFAIVRIYKGFKIYFFVILFGIFLCMSRGGLIMFVLAYLLIFLDVKKYWKIASITTILLSLILIFFIIDLSNKFSYSDLLLDDYLFSTFEYHYFSLFDEYFFPIKSLENRIRLWIFAIDIIKDNFILGIGPGGFRTIVETTPNIEDVWGPHNSVLLLWLNYGLLGLTAYAIYTFMIIKKLAKLSCLYIYYRIFIATLILVIFGIFEPLVGSISYEILIALVLVEANSALYVEKNNIT
jgi:hypothetical protein